MNKTRIVALISSLLFTGIAWAAPAVQFPTGDTAWSVDFTYSPAAAPAFTPQPGKKPLPPPKRAKRIEVTQVGKVKRIRIIWMDGPPTEEWAIPNLPVVFKGYTDGSVASVQSGSKELMYDNLDSPYDSSAFDWLTPDKLQSQTPVAYQGKQCLYYAATVASPGGEGHKAGAPAAAAASRQAWIDSKTLLPVVLNTGSAVCVFTFADKPPVGPLEPPANFKQQITYYKKVMGYPAD
jgi:hypothetical protein